MQFKNFEEEFFTPICDGLVAAALIYCQCGYYSGKLSRCKRAYRTIAHVDALGRLFFCTRGKLKFESTISLDAFGRTSITQCSKIQNISANVFEIEIGFAHYSIDIDQKYCACYLLGTLLLHYFFQI